MTKKRHGGGRVKGSGKGRQTICRSISMHPELWAKLDRIKGERSRSRWVAERVENESENIPAKPSE